MFETHLLLIVLWTVAGIAWVLHSRSLSRNAEGQWMLEGLGLERAADVMMLCVVLGLSGLAEWNHWRQSPNAVRVTPQAERRTDDAERVTANAERLLPYVASIRLDSKTYHLRTCSKYVPKLGQHIEQYETSVDAESHGKIPCSFCIGRSVALVAHPLPQHSKQEADDEGNGPEDGSEHSALPVNYRQNP